MGHTRVAPTIRVWLKVFRLPKRIGPIVSRGKPASSAACVNANKVGRWWSSEEQPSKHKAQMTGLFFFNRWRHQAEKNVGPSWRRHLPLSLASKITTKSRKEPTRFIDHAPSSVCWTAATNNSIEQGGSKSKRWRWSAHRSTPKRDRGLKLNLPVRTRRRAYFCSVWLLAFSFCWR
jgi:hypothetical protein